MTASKESFMFTVGKLDAGMAILLGERAHLIEFPSILLPPGATAGSIVNISVQQNHEEEERRDHDFWALQNEILAEFGQKMPAPPQLELRNVTQTAVTLEWPPLQLETAKLRSLDIYRNGQRLAPIPAPLQNTSTKLSGLDIDHEYTFQLILRTTAGVYPSNVITVRTHTMTDTSGISVCFGNVQDTVLLEHAKLALTEMRACWSDKIQIDTTHFVCTTPAATPIGAAASGNATSAPGVEYQRALQLSIPVVQPHWILACHKEGRMVPISGFYLGATPKAPMDAPPFARPQSMSGVSLPLSPAGTGNAPRGAGNRASMPPMSRTATDAPLASPKSPETQARTLPPFAEEAEPPSPVRGPGGGSNSGGGDGGGGDSAAADPESVGEGDVDVQDEDAEMKTPTTRKKPSSNARERKGTMDKTFRFPPASPVEPVPPLPSIGAAAIQQPPAEVPAVHVVAPSSIDVPPPPAAEKERKASISEDVDEEVGMTEEIPL